MKQMIQVGRIAAIYVGEDATDFEMKGHRLVYFPINNKCLYSVTLPSEGNWTILGRALELTEEQKVLTIMHSSISDKTIVITGRLDVFYDAFLEAHQIDNNYILILKNEG